MRKGTKKLLVFSSLALACCTSLAGVWATMPRAHAESGSSTGGSAQIIVRVHSGNAELKIEEPYDGMITYQPIVQVSTYYDDMNVMKYELEWTSNEAGLYEE